MTTTQSAHPWRATIRTAVAAIIALATMAPIIYTAITQEDPGKAVGAAAGVLAVASAVTRVAALPGVETFLQRFVPWLAAAARDEGALVPAEHGADAPDVAPELLVDPDDAGDEIADLEAAEDGGDGGDDADPEPDDAGDELEDDPEPPGRHVAE